MLVSFLTGSLVINFSLVMQVAGDLLKQYQEKFRGGTLAVTWNYLRESMNTYLSQPNPVTVRWEGEEHLRDPKFQLDAFRVSNIFFVSLIYRACFNDLIAATETSAFVCLWFFLLQYRTSRLLQSVAVRLRKHSKTLGSFGAWNRCLNHLLTLAESHIESVILAKFIDAVERYFLSLASKLLSIFF